MKYDPPRHAYPCIIYLDEKLCAVSKPSGLLSVPGKTEPDCMESRLQKHIADARTIHRLDMDTSGVLLYARDPDTHRNLGLQFERRKTSKTYISVVWGHIKDDQGTIDLPLICDWPNRPRQKVDHEIGKPAQTHWRVMERTHTADNHPMTRIELTPITGRSHQLRVHMLELGHPILGDDLYAHNDALNAAPRLCLHAQSLSFHHPDGGHIITCFDPCPF